DPSGVPVFVNSPEWFDQSMGIDRIVAPLTDDWSAVDRSLGSAGTVERSWEVAISDSDTRWFSARPRREATEGQGVGALALITALTPSLRAEAELAEIRWRDSLTGLINRARFLDLLEPMAARVAPGMLGVAAIDIDGFKRINETAGYAAADAVLIEAARRL